MEILKTMRFYAMFGPEIKNIIGFKVFIGMDSKPISEVERNSNQSSSNSNSFVVDYMFFVALSKQKVGYWYDILMVFTSFNSLQQNIHDIWAILRRFLVVQITTTSANINQTIMILRKSVFFNALHSFWFPLIKDTFAD